jgi:uncharacterized protein (TIGR03437 family)
MRSSIRLALLTPTLVVASGGIILWWLLPPHFNPTAEELANLERARRKAAQRLLPYDQPAEAMAYDFLKRVPEGETEIPVERYLIAREQMRKMRLYSTAEGRFLPQHNLTSAETTQGALGSWSPLGPGNIGGRTRAMLIHPANPQIIYAAGVAGGVWKSTNGGASWTPLTDLIANIAVNSLAMDPTNPEVIYAGTGQGTSSQSAQRGAGIFKTTNGGVSWTYLTNTNNSDFYYVNDLVVSPNNNQRIYAGTRTGVWRSDNGGINWVQVLPLTVNSGCMDLAIRTDKQTDYIFAAAGNFAQGTIYRNTDAGGAGLWEAVLTEPNMGRAALAIAPSNQNIIYAVTASIAPGNYQNGLHAVFRSTSSGDAGTWTAQVRNTDAKKLNTLLLTNTILASGSECGFGSNSFFNQGWLDIVIAVDPIEPNIVWVGGIDLFRSDDGGQNWGLASHWWASRSNPRYNHADHHVLLFHPQYNGTTNKTLYTAGDGGIFRTDDARAATATATTAPCSTSNGSVSWTALNNNYGVTQFYHGVPYPDGKTYFGGTQDNGTVRGNDTDGLNAWQEILGGDGGYVAVDPTNSNIIYAETQNGEIRKSTNGGQSFTLATSGITGSGFLFITPFIMDPSDPQRLWTGGSALWRTKDGMSSWTQASSSVVSGSVSAIAIAPTNANYMLAGTSTGRIYRTDQGLTSKASTVWPSVQPRSGFVSWVSFDPTDANIAYATYSTFGGIHVWKSVDAGASWTGIDGSGATAIPDIPVHCILVDPTNTSRLYVGTDLGVFVSLDGGASWAVENTGFANVLTESLSLNTANGETTLFAFTRGRGAYRVSLGSGCSQALSLNKLNFLSAGGTGSVNVTSTTGSCHWTVSSNESWITITSGDSGSGDGTVNFTVAANTGGPRVGTIAVAGRSVTITQDGTLANVSAASFATTIASEAITAAFGVNLATTTAAATSMPLPTSLAGTTVEVTDSVGTKRLAPLFFVSSGQVNYQIPPETANGVATVTIKSGDGWASSGTINITQVAPGIFAANANGQGVAAAVVLRVRSDGSQVYEQVAQFDPSQNKFVSRPIELGPETDRLFLILFGTGIRFHGNLSQVRVSFGGTEVEATFAGAQGNFIGLDQINVPIGSLRGGGEMDVILRIGAQAANTVRINIG